MEATQTTLPTGNITVNANGAEKQETTILDVSSFPTMEQLERQYITLVLEKSGGSKTQAAKILGFSVKTIYNKLDAYKTNEAAKTVRNSP